MNETLKMVRFDYAIVKSMGAKYVWILAGICVALCLIGMFPAALGFLLFPLGIFSPMQTVRKGDFMKIYGLLPVQRAYVTKALFWEITVPQLIGGAICEILLFLSRTIGESHILPQVFQTYIYDNFAQGIGDYTSYNNLFSLAAVGLAFITIIVLFFYMILEIKGETFAIVCCIPFVLLIGFAVVLYVISFNNLSTDLPTLNDMLPHSTAMRVVAIIASFAAIVAAACSLCALTVKKTAKKEL